MPDRYRKRPVVVEAMQIDGSYDSAREATSWIAAQGGTAVIVSHHVTESAVSIHTLEGVMRADPGDWIIRGVQGEFYPCKPDIFAGTYERA